MNKRALVSSLGDVDIRLLRIFVTVTECGGFAASELELNIGRSTISKYIADLETRIGLRLCHRGPSGFALTPEGDMVLDATRRLLSKIDSFQSEIDNIHSNLAGTLRLGIFDQSSTNPEAQLHMAIRKFHDDAPDVTLEIVLETPSVLESRLLDGSLDAIIAPIYRQSSSLSYRPLYTETMTLYCGEDHPLFGCPADTTPESLDLASQTYAGYSFNSPNMMAGRDLGLVRSARVKEEEALALLIQSGRYIGYLANHVAETFFAKGKVWPLSPAHTSYKTVFGVVTRRKPEPDRKTARFVECLVDVHGAGAKKLLD